ncbi:MAG: tetratricopeptide repeat protein, partial [Candidatus Thorarchaeota archaeon]
PVVRSDITLYHYGYDLSPDKLREKRQRSRTLLEKQLADDPNDVFANFNMAQLLIGLHGTGDARTCERILGHARRVIEHADPGNTGHIGYRLMAHHQMAIALSALARYDEAEKYCRDALEEKDDYIDAILTLANICLAKADLDAARAQYERFLSAVDSYRPRHECHDIIMHYLLGRHIARYGLATIYRLQGMIDEALKEYYAVLRECPAYLDTRYQAGMLHLRRGEPARAEDIVKQGLESDPDSIPLLIAMARAVEAQGRGDRAVAWLETALVRAPRDSDVMLALAKTLVRLGRRDDGGHYLEEMLTADPANPRAAFAAAGVYFDLGEYERARTLYRLSLEHNPFWPEAYTNLGNCFYKKEHYEAARAAYETALALSPDSGLARRNLALTYARRCEYDRALAIIQDHAGGESATTDMLKLTGDLLLLSGRYAEAIDRYERHLSTHPGDTDCLFHIAEAYRKSGYFESAAAGYRHILKIAPDHKPAAQRLELVENVAPAN